jgi:hypothetical protein
MEIQCDSKILLLDTYLKGMKSSSQKDICTFMFIAALLRIAKMCNLPMCSSVNDWIMWYSYTVSWFSHEYDDNKIVIWNNIDVTGSHYVKWSKAKKGQMLHDLWYTWNLKCRFHMNKNWCLWETGVFVLCGWGVFDQWIQNYPIYEKKRRRSIIDSAEYNQQSIVLLRSIEVWH